MKLKIIEKMSFILPKLPWNPNWDTIGTILKEKLFTAIVMIRMSLNSSNTLQFVLIFLG